MTITIEDADVVTLKHLAQKYGLCTSPPNPGTSRPGLYYGYYGGGVVSEFSDHCNFLHIGAWGDWASIQGREDLTNYAIQQIQDAVAHGITKVMPTFDWCLFQPNWRPLPVQQAQNYTIAFVDALVGAGVSKYVAAIYTLDEPDVQGLTRQQVFDANSILRDVFSWYPDLKGKPLVTTYGVEGTPGIESFDWAGFDNYGTPIFTNGEYDAFMHKLSPNQKVTLIPGGGSPWRDDPTPFNLKAQQDPRVILIMPFIWQDGTNQGIRSNGMKATYAAIGTPIKSATP